MQAKIIRIPNQEGSYTELTRDELKELIETSSPGEFYTKIKTADTQRIELILRNEFGKTYPRMRIDYLKSRPDLEASIIQSESLEEFVQQYRLDGENLCIALREKFGGTFIEVKVIGKFRDAGIRQSEIKAAVAASSSQESLARQIKETVRNLGQFLRKRFGASYYEIKHQGATSKQLVTFYKKLWDVEGYDSLPLHFLREYLGKTWRKKLENPDTGSDAVLVPYLQEVPEMQPETMTTDDLLELITSKSIDELQVLLGKSSIGETLSYIQKKMEGKLYGYILLDTYDTKEKFLERIDRAGSIKKFYQALFLTEAEFVTYTRIRFITKLSADNQVVFRPNSRIAPEVLIEAVRNDGKLEKPKRQIETVDKVELRQKIMDCTKEELLLEFNITDSVLRHVVPMRFEGQSYLEVKLSDKFKTKDELRAAIDRTEKLDDLAEELGVEAPALGKYVRSRLGEIFSHIKLKKLTDEELEELFAKCQGKTELLFSLCRRCGAGTIEAKKFLIEKYGPNWDYIFSRNLKGGDTEKAGRKRPATDLEEPSTTRKAPAAAGQPTSRSKPIEKTSSFWQPVSKSREKESGDEGVDEDYKDDPIWGDIINVITNPPSA